MSALPTRQALIAAGERPRRFGSWYVAEHRIRSMRAYATTLIVTSFANPAVYLFALGIGLGSLVNRSSGGGLGYLAFVAPALIASAAVTVAGEEFTYPMMMGFKWNPIFFAMNAAPISAYQIVNGMVIAALARILPTAAVYFVIMVLFGAAPSGVAVVQVLTAALTGLAVGLVIMPYTASIEEDKGQMAMIQRFGILPMFLFSGTFFPLTQLPVGLQWIGWISPLWHGTQLGRVFNYGMVEPAWLTVIHLVYLLALCAVGWRLARRVFARRLNK
ncbi:lipooligosaccharide transport system permease protein [Galbitalea soli]|nr:lipooligosaccharide transport system permease protein [Galbitalea soli]